MDFRQFQLAFVAIKIGLPRCLADAPKSPDEVASALGLPSERLARVLRGLVWSGHLSVDDEGRYGLTKAGQALLDDGPLGQAQGIRFQAEFFYRAWAGLPEYVATGAIPFENEHGCGIFEYIQREPALAELYASPMAQRSSQYSAAIASHPALAQAGTIVDVGGGHGRLLTDLLRITPHATGIVFDLPVMRSAAIEIIGREDLSNRCRFEAGDMFHSVPESGDVYLLKWILHDWPDAEAKIVMARCAHAMKAGAKLLVIERLLPLDPSAAARSPLVQADLNMMCLSGGAERTLDDYRQLAEQAGLTFISCTPIEETYGFHAIECARLGG